MVAKAAMTLDGRIATAEGESRWITGERARKEAHRLRAECGAVLVGRKTIERDDPRLTVRAVRVRNQPTRIVLDPQRRIDAGRQVFNSEAPTIRIVGGQARAGEMRVALKDGRIGLHELLESLFKRGITSLLVEGGGHTIGSFLDAGLVDRLELFVAGMVFGEGISWAERRFSGSVSAADGFTIGRVRRAGDDLWITCFPLR